MRIFSIARVAKEDELTVLITDADGNIEMGAKPDGTTYTLPGYHISNEVVAEMHKNGSYASVGSLGVLSESSFYTVGTCVKDDNGDADLMIFVSTQDPNSAGVVRHSTQTLVQKCSRIRSQHWSRKSADTRVILSCERHRQCRMKTVFLQWRSREPPISKRKLRAAHCWQRRII